MPSVLFAFENPEITKFGAHIEFGMKGTFVTRETVIALSELHSRMREGSKSMREESKRGVGCV